MQIVVGIRVVEYLVVVVVVAVVLVVVEYK